MAGLAVAALAYFWLRLIESNDVIFHLVVWHFLPIILLSLAGMWIGKTWLKW